jgi:hypothetical protein
MTKEQEQEKKRVELALKRNKERAKLDSMVYAYCQLAKAIVDECDECDIENGIFMLKTDVIARSFSHEIYLAILRLLNAELKLEKGTDEISLDLNDLQ